MFWIYLDPCLLSYLETYHIIPEAREACMAYLGFSDAERALCLRSVDLDAYALWLSFRACLLS